MILGSGSASFEMLRYLVERLPVMITPRWLRTPCQPIAISNVLDYLAGCLSAPQTTGKTLDIGGPDILNYQDLIDIYRRVAGLPKADDYLRSGFNPPAECQMDPFGHTGAGVHRPAFGRRAEHSRDLQRKRDS